MYSYESKLKLETKRAKRAADRQLQQKLDELNARKNTVRRLKRLVKDLPPAIHEQEIK
jgi:hypothetical protein